MNINSLRNKFDQLKILIQDKTDILVVTESKIDDMFPDFRFHIPGYKVPFRKDRSKLGGGIIVFVRDDIPCKKLDVRIPEDIEALFLEINLRHTKWLFCGCYHPPSQNDAYFYQNLSNCLDLFSKKYTNFFLAGDFNSEETETVLSEFLNSHDAKNMVKEKTCFKSMNNPTCVDLLISNKEKCFKSAATIDTGLSDFHKMVLVVLKKKFERAKPKVISYRDYRHFDGNSFRCALRFDLSKISTHSYSSFEKVFLETLNDHAPLKQKKQSVPITPLYMTKILRKAMMHRSQLETKYRKQPTKSSVTENKRIFAANYIKKNGRNIYILI